VSDVTLSGAPVGAVLRDRLGAEWTREAEGAIFDGSSIDAQRVALADLAYCDVRWAPWTLLAMPPCPPPGALREAWLRALPVGAVVEWEGDRWTREGRGLAVTPGGAIEFFSFDASPAAFTLVSLSGVPAAPEWRVATVEWLESLPEGTVLESTAGSAPVTVSGGRLEWEHVTQGPIGYGFREHLRVGPDVEFRVISTPAPAEQDARALEAPPSSGLGASSVSADVLRGIAERALEQYANGQPVVLPEGVSVELDADDRIIVTTDATGHASIGVDFGFESAWEGTVHIGGEAVRVTAGAPWPRGASSVNPEAEALRAEREERIAAELARGVAAEEREAALVAEWWPPIHNAPDASAAALLGHYEEPASAVGAPAVGEDIWTLPRGTTAADFCTPELLVTAETLMDEGFAAQVVWVRAGVPVVCMISHLAETRKDGAVPWCDIVLGAAQRRVYLVTPAPEA